jgi:hypothetical protein
VWARLVVESRGGAQHITFSCREPGESATAKTSTPSPVDLGGARTGKRRQNWRRKQRWREKRAGMTAPSPALPSCPAAVTPNRPPPARPPPSLKRRRIASPSDEAIPQLDGATCETPVSPAESSSPPSTPSSVTMSAPVRRLALTYVQHNTREAVDNPPSPPPPVVPVSTPGPAPQPAPWPAPTPSTTSQGQRGAATYAAVAAQGVSSFPPIRLTRPTNGSCEAIFRPDGERCNDYPVYNTNYGRYCEDCIRGHFLNYKQTDLYIY